MLRWPRPVSFVNGRVVTAAGIATSIRFARRVLSVGEGPHPRDEVIDLEGAFVLPGLINAHDHLELNHYGALKRRDRYTNATAWIDDLRPALRDDPAIRANQAHSLADRVFIGGLKNLLSGVTTVAHHNPLYSELRRHVPVRVVRRFGWAHSLALEGLPVGAHGEPGGRVEERYRATSPERPFIVHAGEGIDRAAHDELLELDRRGCIGANTVIVHGVAVDAEVWRTMERHGASLVWCPSSNAFLFGQTAPVRLLLDASQHAARHIALATDSRVTGSRDLLDELREAAGLAAVTPRELLQMVTAAAASVLRLTDAGSLRTNGMADFVVVPAAADAESTIDGAARSLLAARRADVDCVVLEGRPLAATPRFARVFRARAVTGLPMSLDHTDHVVDAWVARRAARCAIREPGLSLPD